MKPRPTDPRKPSEQPLPLSTVVPLLLAAGLASWLAFLSAARALCEALL